MDNENPNPNPESDETYGAGGGGGRKGEGAKGRDGKWKAHRSEGEDWSGFFEGKCGGQEVEDNDTWCEGGKCDGGKGKGLRANDASWYVGG